MSWFKRLNDRLNRGAECPSCAKLRRQLNDATVAISHANARIAIFERPRQADGRFVKKSHAVAREMAAQMGVPVPEALK